jgi:hypothetical protein
MSQGKSLDTVLRTIESADRNPKEVVRRMPRKLRVHWPHMAGKNHVLNRTTFSFNDDGIAEVDDVGNASLDVHSLVRHKQKAVLLPCEEPEVDEVELVADSVEEPVVEEVPAPEERDYLVEDAGSDEVPSMWSTAEPE